MQRGISQQPPIEQQFFSQQNQTQLYNSCIQQVSAQAGGLNQKQQGRLIKALGHYMQEVWDENGPEPLPKLNRDVLMATTNDLMKYLRREQVVPESVAAAATYVADTRNQPMMEMASQRLAIQQGSVTVPPRPTFEQGLLLDTGSRFEQLQQERAGPKETRPTVPDFQISLTTSSEEPSALSLFENARKAREEEAARAPVAGTTKTGSAPSDANPLVRFMSPPSLLGDANANPTLSLPNQLPAPRGPLPQDYLIKQDDVISYREVEYNLFLYSADRDWLTNVKETRYNFSVNFDPANNRQGFTLSPSTTKKFRNIQRIELVKCIMPTEGIDNLVTYASGTYSSASKINILSFPYIIVRIPELDTNNFGTDNNLDNAFGVVQYDANWYTDTTNLSDGYLGMIPKFMKCQKVYHPTPLATLTHLTIQLQRPDGQYISDIPDTVSIQNIYASGTTPPGPAFLYNGNYTSVTLASGAVYYIIRTTTWFSQWMFQKGNRIQIKGLNATDIANPITQAAQNFVDYMQQDDGLLIVGIGQDAATNPDQPNSVGYANIIIVQAPLAPVTAATPDVQPFGGSSTTNTALATALQSTTFNTAKLINLTHQTNVVLRIITREMDPTARVRPDNL